MEFNVEEDELKQIIRHRWGESAYGDCILEHFDEFNCIFNEKMCAMEEEFAEMVDHCIGEAVEELRC